MVDKPVNNVDIRHNFANFIGYSLSLINLANESGIGMLGQN
jgi:hypothetical protein